MEGISSALNFGFIFTLIITIILFIVSVILFFTFDIRTIYSIRSGRAQAKAVENMAKENAKTGHLRYQDKKVQEKVQSNYYENNNYQYSNTDNKVYPNLYKKELDTTTALPSMQEETQLLPTPASETTLLGNDNISSDENSTEVLGSNINNYQYDNYYTTDEIAINNVQEPNLYFEVVKKVISSFSNEVIY